MNFSQQLKKEMIGPDDIAFDYSNEKISSKDFHSQNIQFEGGESDGQVQKKEEIKSTTVQAQFDTESEELKEGDSQSDMKNNVDF